jgi:CHRD domain
MKRLGILAVALLLAGCGTFYPSAPADKTRFTAALNGDSTGKGSLNADYSPATQILHWRLSYSGMSGPVTWGYLVGPDQTGAEAEIVPINLTDESNPHPGAATLTAQQAADLLAGRWSVTIKTEQYPGGEIKGALVRNAR